MEIIHYATEQGWDKSERQIENYIRKARQLLLEDARLERTEWLSEALARLRRAERDAGALKQPAIVIQSVLAQAKLIGWKDDGA